MGEVENAPEIPVVAFPAIVTDRADAPAGLPSFPSMVQKRPQDFSEVPWNTLPISIAACWSRRHYREVAGIRKRTLIVNLPGSKKASRENLSAVLGAIGHGLDMLCSQGSADCAAPTLGEAPPSADAWLREAKALESAGKIGMYLFHNGVVRETARSRVREGNAQAKSVSGMRFTYDEKKVQEAVEKTRSLPGIYHVRVWLNHGGLKVGDDLMRVLVGGDIRPHVVAALEFLVTDLKTRCVTEEEL